MVKYRPDEEIEEPDEEDFRAEIKEARPRGILYERPKSKDLASPLLFVALCVVTSMLFWKNESIASSFWASKKTVFDNGEYFRLLSALFTHADMRHLLSNLPLFFVFGWFLRTYFGILAFPLGAVCAGIASNLVTLYFYPENVRLIGASGMVYAMVASWVTFYARYELRFSLPQKMVRIVGALLVLLFPTSYSPTTSYLAHASGFVFGVMGATILMATGIYDRKQNRIVANSKTFGR